MHSTVGEPLFPAGESQRCTALRMLRPTTPRERGQPAQHPLSYPAPAYVYDDVDSAPHPSSKSKSRSNWLLRMMRKYEVTPKQTGTNDTHTQSGNEPRHWVEFHRRSLPRVCAPRRAALWLCFLTAFCFLLYSYLTARPPPPPLARFHVPSAGPQTVLVETEEAQRLAKLHRATLEEQGVSPPDSASEASALLANPSAAKELEKFFQAQRLKAQQAGDIPTEAKFDGALGQPRLTKETLAAMAAAAAAAAANLTAQFAPASTGAAALSPEEIAERIEKAEIAELRRKIGLDASTGAAASAASGKPGKESKKDKADSKKHEATKPVKKDAKGKPKETPAEAEPAVAAGESPAAAAAAAAHPAAADPTASAAAAAAVDENRHGRKRADKEGGSTRSDENDSASTPPPAQPPVTPAPLKPSVSSKALKSSAAAVAGNSLSGLTSPTAPLAPSVDASLLYDSPERRAARTAALAAGSAAPLPASVTGRPINNAVFPLNKEAPLNEEWREEVVSRLSQEVAAPGIVTSMTSPDGGLELSIFLDAGGQIGYSVSMRAGYSGIARTMKEEGVIKSIEEAEGTFLLPSLLSLTVDSAPCALAVSAQGKANLNWKLTKGFSLWHPVPKAERSEYAESFTQLTLWNGVGTGDATKDEAALGSCGAFQFHFRLFNTGLGVRAVVTPLRKSASPALGPGGVDLSAVEGDFIGVSWSLGMRLQDGLTSSRCAANNYEEPFVRPECHDMHDAMMTPLVVETAATVEGAGVKRKGKTSRGPRFLTVTQAAGPGFVRSTVVAPAVDAARPHRTELILATKGEAPLAPKDPLTLGVIATDDLPGAQAGALGTATSWHVILFAASLRHLPHTSHLAPLLCDPPLASAHPDWADSRWVPTGKLMRITKFSTAYSHSVVDWASANNFQLVHFDAGWYGDEYKKTSSAKAVLPAFAPQLDVANVAAYANSHGLRLCLYVNELALRDTAELVDIYSGWGVGGVKFGFVEVGEPRAMRVLHQRIIAFGSKGLFINVHDSYRPRGLTRSYPFLVTQEGVRGEERKPDALHHTLLPFIRTLQGSADYTPRFLNGAGLQCTKSHQLALPLVVYSPIQSLFWAEPIEPVGNAVANWNKELVIWTRMPSTWDDTRFLAGEMGELVTVARRDGRDWYVAALTNNNAREGSIDLNVLWDDWAGHPALPTPPTTAGYIVHSYKDGLRNPARADPFSVKVAPRKLFWMAPPKRFWPKGTSKQPKPPKEGQRWEPRDNCSQLRTVVHSHRELRD